MGPGTPLWPGPIPALALTWAEALLGPGTPLWPGPIPALALTWAEAC
jgi:hypothetical protein